MSNWIPIQVKDMSYLCDDPDFRVMCDFVRASGFLPVYTYHAGVAVGMIVDGCIYTSLRMANKGTTAGMLHRLIEHPEVVWDAADTEPLLLEKILQNSDIQGVFDHFVTLHLGTCYD